MVERKTELTETHLYELYKQGVDYQYRIGIRKSIPECVRFYEGNQWPSPTENTKNLPRPVVNVIKMICRSKKSAILSTPVKVSFKSYSSGVDVSRFNSFADSIFKEMGQEDIDRLAMDDGIKKGSYFYHYYWDSEAVDLNGIMDGGVGCELINPLNIFFENPSQINEQKQKWILISTQLDLNSVLSLVKDVKITRSQLEADKNEDGSVTLFTRYFRIGGEVYCEKGTKSLIVAKPFPIAPETEDDVPDGRVRANLYPVVCGFYERREGSIYGISEVEELIPNQKAINFNIAMSLLNAQECAWGKYVALPNALKGQKISNVPGQVLIDHSGTGDGIKRLREQSISDVPISITSQIIDMTKSTSGASGIISGDKEWSNMSGTAIAQLQAQSLLPIEELRNQFWEAKRKQGLIVAQFMKLYYYKRKFVTVKTQNGGEREIFDYFTSADYKNAIFDVCVEITGASKSISASEISVLDSCLASGSISIETFIKAYPDSAFPNKTELLKQIELEKNSELYKLREELKALKKEGSKGVNYGK